MNICLLGDGCSPIIRSWVDYFAEQHHEVSLITANMKTPDFTANKEYTYVFRVSDEQPKKVLTFLRIIWRTRQIIKHLRPDVIHAHSMYVYGVPAALSGFHPFVGTQMGDDLGVLTYKSWIGRHAVRYVLKKTDALFAKDIYAWERAEQLGCKREKIHLMTSTCDTGRFAPSARLESLRASLGVDPNDVLAIFTRPFTDQYRVECLEKALNHVFASTGDVKILLLERGNYERYKERLTCNHVIWHPAIPHEEFHKYLASSDLFIDTFVPRDGMLGHAHGTAVVEAMACGLPLILPDKPEFHFPWFNATLFPIEDPVKFASEITWLASNSAMRKVMGDRARELAVQYFDRSVVMGRAMAIYKSLGEAREHGH